MLVHAKTITFPLPALDREYLIRPKHIPVRFNSRRKAWNVRHTSFMAGWSRSPVPFLKPRTDKAHAGCFSQKACVSAAACQLETEYCQV